MSNVVSIADRIKLHAANGLSGQSPKSVELVIGEEWIVPLLRNHAAALAHNLLCFANGWPVKVRAGGFLLRAHMDILWVSAVPSWGIARFAISRETAHRVATELSVRIGRSFEVKEDGGLDGE